MVFVHDNNMLGRNGILTVVDERVLSEAGNAARVEDLGVLGHVQLDAAHVFDRHRVAAAKG